MVIYNTRCVSTQFRACPFERALFRYPKPIREILHEAKPRFDTESKNFQDLQCYT